MEVLLLVLAVICLGVKGLHALPDAGHLLPFLSFLAYGMLFWILKSICILV